jgi:hypothetical protein
LIQQLQKTKSNELNNASNLAEFIPLFQTILWIIVAVCIIYFFRNEIKVLRFAIASRLANGEEISIGVLQLKEIKKEVTTIQDNLVETNNRVSRLFITAMGLDMYKNLKKMQTGAFGKFQKSKGLIRELYYLRDIGYIKIPSIADIPESGEELSRYVTVTTIGEEFIKLREEFQS